MRTSFLLVIALAIVSCEPARSSFARYPSAAPVFDRAAADPKALAIADRVLAAAGGAARWSQIKQLRWNQTVTSGGNSLAFEEAWDRWNGRHYVRLHKSADKTFVGSSMTATQGKHGAEGDVVVMRKLYEAGGNAFYDTGRGLSPLLAAEAERALTTARERWQFDVPLLCMAFLLEQPGTTLEYVGEVAAEPGQPPLDELKVTLDPKDPSWGATYHVMVQRQTGLIERLEIVKAGQPDNQRIAFRLAGWIDTGGLKLATRYENLGVADEVIALGRLTAGEPDDALYVPSVQ